MVYQLHTNQIRSYFVCDAYNNYVTVQRMVAGYNNRGEGRLFLEIWNHFQNNVNIV